MTDDLRGALRQSTLSAFDACALYSRFETEAQEGKDGTTGWASHPQARGRVFHAVAGECFREMARHGEGRIPVDVAMAILHEQLRMATGELLNLPMREVADLAWVTRKWATDNEWDIEALVDVEERLWTTLRFEAQDGLPMERKITGTPDVVFSERDGLVVYDWKDTWGMPPETEVSFAGYPQQRFYALLLFANYKAAKWVSLREFYVRFSQTREAVVHREDMGDIEAQVAALVARYTRAEAENVWPPTPGVQCRLCLQPMRCPIPKFARGVGRVTTQREAEAVARQLVVAEAAGKQAKRALMNWADAHGPIEIRDAKGRRAWGYRGSESVQRPSRADLERALARGDVDLDRLYKTRRSTRFEEHTPERRNVDKELLASLQESLAEAKARKATEEA